MVISQHQPHLESLGLHTYFTMLYSLVECLQSTVSPITVGYIALEKSDYHYQDYEH